MTMRNDLRSMVKIPKLIFFLRTKLNPNSVSIFQYTVPGPEVEGDDDAPQVPPRRDPSHGAD